MFFSMIMNGFSIEEKTANILKNWNFEKKLSGWNVPDWIKDALKPELDNSTFKEGSSSISFNAEPGKRIFVMQSMKRNPETAEYLFTGWIKTKDTVNFTPYVTFEAMSSEKGKEKFTDIQISVDIPASLNDWIKVERKVEVPAGTKDIRLMLMSRSDMSKPSSGTVWFDCCQLEELVSKADKITVKSIVPDGDKGIFKKNETPSFTVFITNSFGIDKDVEMETVVLDYFGKETERQLEKFSLPALSVTKRSIQLKPVDKEGFYSVRPIIKSNGIPYAGETGSFVVTEPIEKPDPFFGLCDYYFPTENITTVRLMGCGSAGEIISWRNEYVKGKFKWDGTDYRIRKFQELGMQIIGQFNVMGDHYSQPDWVTSEIKANKKKGLNPYTEDYYKNMAAFEKLAIERYKDSISEWSAINEIDLSMHKDTFEKEHYIRAVKELYAAMKSVNPEFELGAIGVSGCDGQKNPRFPVAGMLWERLHDSIDGMAYDAYVDPKTYGPGYNPPGPERGNFRDILLKSVELAKKYGKKFIAIDEKGDKIVSALPVDSIYAKRMSEALVRSYVIARSVPENRHWLYFIFTGAQEGNADYGLWRANCPRPTVAAYATVARRLAHVSDPVVVDINKDIYCFVFAKGHCSVTAIWTVNEKPVIFDVEVPEDSSIYDIMNNPGPLKKGKQQLILSKSPFFIESAAVPSDMEKAMKSAYFTLPELNGEIKLKSLSEISVAVANNSNKKLAVDLIPETKNITIEPKKKSLELPSSSDQSACFSIVNGNFDDLNGKDIKLEAVVDKTRKYVFAYKPELLKVEKIKTPVKIDGNIDEFKDIKPIVLDNASFLFPADALPNKLWTGPEDLSCKIYLAYDNENFYFVAEVVDDVAVNERGGFRMWSNDSFQIAFDTMNDALSEELSKNMGYDLNDYEFGVGLTPKGPECFCYAAGLENKELDNKTTPFKVMVKKAANGNMLYELAIPWSALAPLKPVPGTAFGFNFINLDSDESGKSSLYGIGLTPGIVEGKKPNEFKTFILMP